MRIPEYRLPVMLLAVLTPAILTCKDESSVDNVDPATVEAFLQGRFGNIPNLAGALERVMLTIGDPLNPQPGVSITVTSTGGTGSVQVDVDGDGTSETTANGTLTFFSPSLGFAGGALLEITGITGRPVQVHMTSSVFPTSPTAVQFTGVEASFQSAGNRPEVEVTDAEVYVDVAAPDARASVGSSAPAFLIQGYADFNVGSLFAVMLFEDDGAGGLLITVIGENFEFTVP